MADFADDAFELQEQELAHALAARKPVGIQPMGSCFYCEASVGEGALFCDHECAADWHEEQRLLQLAGKPSRLMPRQSAAPESR